MSGTNPDSANRGQAVQVDVIEDTAMGGGASPEELSLLAALRRGDEEAFLRLVDQHGPALLRVAMMFVRERAVAEEVVQETWLGVLRGLDRFEGRSSLKTWIFRILTNKAKTRAQREGRTVAFSSLAPFDDERDDPAVEPERFLPADHAQWPGHWASNPRSWEGVPEARLLSQETLALVRQTIEGLSQAQRVVITLRDVEGWSSEDVCNFLRITETNQRVLLHRARSRVRRAIEEYLAE
jgi:RNA polymerase sigma-70 factor, ECF subfamily